MQVADYAHHFYVLPLRRHQLLAILGTPAGSLPRLSLLSSLCL